MKLREWDTNQPNQGAYVEREYPDQPGLDFINWFRNTRQWRESPEMVYQRWLKFERELADARNAGLTSVPGQKCSETTKAGNPCKGKPVSDGLCIAHLKAAQAA